MKEVFTMWRHTQMVVLVALSAAIYAAVYALCLRLCGGDHMLADDAGLLRPQPGDQAVDWTRSAATWRN